MRQPDSSELKISNKRKLPWTALLLIAPSLLVTLTSIFHPVYTLRIANWLLLSLFFGYVSVALFSFLRTGGRNQPSRIRCVPRPVSDPWNVLLRCLQLNARGASGIVYGDSAPTPVQASRHSLLYFSLASLTTVGYRRNCCFATG